MKPITLNAKSKKELAKANPLLASLMAEKPAKPAKKTKKPQ